MGAIAEDFGRGGSRFGDFEKRAAAYRERRHELESDPHAPDGIATFITKTAVTIGLAAARDIPFAGSLVAPVDPTATADQVNRARSYLARKFSDHADVRLLLSPAEELTPLFVSGVNRVATDRPVALFVDTYERTGPLLDRWLRRLYAGQYGDLPETLITTISGQHPLDPNSWGDYLPVIADIPLEPFSEAEARQFLASKNIHDESTIQVILTLSRCLPMWLATLAQARPANAADIGDPAGDAVERILRWEDNPARRSIALTAALPRVLNQDVLAVIAPADKARELFGWLCGRPFVTRRTGAWAYHEVVRAAMLRLQRAQAPSGWRSNQVTLARANERWARDAASGDDAWANTDWIDHTREATYHLLCADPINNLAGALASAVMAAAHGILQARQWATLIADAGRDADHPTVRHWGQRLGEGIRDTDLTQYFTHLINDGRLDESALAVALEERGECHRLAGRYEEALADLSRAIQLDSSRARLSLGRGQIYREMKRYTEALADFSNAIGLDPDRAWTFVVRGATYRETERYAEALADYSRAIELDPGGGDAFVLRGETYRQMERPEDALADFNHVLNSTPVMPGPSPSEVRPTGRWDGMTRPLTTSIAPSNSSPATRGLSAAAAGRITGWSTTGGPGRLQPRHRTRPSVCMGLRLSWRDATGRWSAMTEALADDNRAIELDPSQARFFTFRGATYREMERYPEALADFSRATELAPSQAMAIALRGRTYEQMERYAEALTEYTRALELDPSKAWVFALRGRIYRDMTRCQEAVADFSRAIELDPGDDWGISLRGRTYQQMERFEEALADFSRVIELNSGDAGAYAERGGIYREMGRFDKALTDLSRAIELDPRQRRGLRPPR